MAAPSTGHAPVRMAGLAYSDGHFYVFGFMSTARICQLCMTALQPQHHLCLLGTEVHTLSGQVVSSRQECTLISSISSLVAPSMGISAMHGEDSSSARQYMA
jgi:hypothetical protein